MDTQEGKKERELKIEKMKKLFKSLGKEGVPFDPQTIKDKCPDETEKEYKKRQEEWLKNRKK